MEKDKKKKEKKDHPAVKGLKGARPAETPPSAPAPKKQSQTIIDPTRELKYNLKAADVPQLAMLAALMSRGGGKI